VVALKSIKFPEWTKVLVSKLQVFAAVFLNIPLVPANAAMAVKFPSKS
jgi:hypothetical protein